MRTVFLFHCTVDNSPLHGGYRYTAHRTSVHCTVDTGTLRVGLQSTARWTTVHCALDSSPQRVGLESGNVWKIAGLGKLRKADDSFVFMRRLCSILTFRRRNRLRRTLGEAGQQLWGTPPSSADDNGVPHLITYLPVCGRSYSVFCFSFSTNSLMRFISCGICICCGQCGVHWLQLVQWSA